MTHGIDWNVLREHGQIELKEHPFHPLVIVNGNVECGTGVFVGYFTELHATKSKITIGNGTDIASFVAVNCADSHKYTMGIVDEIERIPIYIGDNVTIGSHSFIGGGCRIGHHSVIAAGTILRKNVIVPPYSLVIGSPPIIKGGYYRGKT